MNAHNLPPDLAELETLLCARTSVQPSSDLRRRVLSAVARERVFVRRVQLGAMAAALLVAVSLWTSIPKLEVAQRRNWNEGQFAALEQVGIDRDLARWLELPSPLLLAPPLRGL